MEQRRFVAGQAGMSYLETVLVFVLVGVVLAISFSSFRSYRHYSSTQRALQGARTLASDLRVAQQEAVTRRADLTVNFSSADAACSGWPSYQIANGGATLKRYCFPEDVEWATLPATLTWDPTGITAAGATLTVRSTLSAQTYNVWVAAQTGAITDDTR